MINYIITVSVFLSLLINPQNSFSQLTNAEINGILNLREEEKLAYDIYTYMFEKYSSEVFNNIAKNEKDHMIRIKELIDLYKLDDPISGAEDQRGVYKNKKIQNLYAEMIMSCNYVLVDAMRAAGRFEETDIMDLRKYIAITSDQRVLAVYQILESGSEDHLRTLVKHIRGEGISYKPCLLSKEEFEMIIQDKASSDSKK